MWVKYFKDGSTIKETNSNKWSQTKLDDIESIQLIDKNFVSPKLTGYSEYWHSRTAITTEDGHHEIIRERIQGKREDGRWDTIEWDGKHSIKTYITENALGR